MIVKLERDNGCHGKGGRSHPHHVIIKAIVPYLRAWMPLATHHYRSHDNGSPFHAHVIRFIPSTYNPRSHTYITSVEEFLIQ